MVSFHVETRREADESAALFGGPAISSFFSRCESPAATDHRA